MQLRAARLCLDCEELYVGDSCPVCASEQSIFLSAWLPVEERRRWRRAPHTPASRTERRMTAFRQFMSDFFGDGSPVQMPGPVRTRAADHVPTFDHDKAAATAAQPTSAPSPIKSPR